jgi:hypothetical protein
VEPELAEPRLLDRAVDTVMTRSRVSHMGILYASPPAPWHNHLLDRAVDRL